MDRDEMRKVKFYGTICLLFLLSMWQSWRELKYALWGELATATVARVKEVSGSRVGSKQLNVEFRYPAEGAGIQTELERVPLDTAIAEGDEISIQYIPGEEDSARLDSRTSMGAVYMFFGSLVAMGFVGFRIWKMAHEAVHGSSRRRR